MYYSDKEFLEAIRLRLSKGYELNLQETQALLRIAEGTDNTFSHKGCGETPEVRLTKVEKEIEALKPVVRSLVYDRNVIKEAFRGRG